MKDMTQIDTFREKAKPQTLQELADVLRNQQVEGNLNLESVINNPEIKGQVKKRLQEIMTGLNVLNLQMVTQEHVELQIPEIFLGPKQVKKEILLSTAVLNVTAHLPPQIKKKFDKFFDSIPKKRNSGELPLSFAVGIISMLIAMVTTRQLTHDYELMFSVMALTLVIATVVSYLIINHYIEEKFRLLEQQASTNIQTANDILHKIHDLEAELKRGEQTDPPQVQEDLKRQIQTCLLMLQNLIHHGTASMTLEFQGKIQSVSWEDLFGPKRMVEILDHEFEDDRVAIEEAATGEAETAKA